MHRLSQRALLLCALVVSGLGVSALGAQAKTSPTPTKAKFIIVKSGTTKITVTDATAKFLATEGIIPTAIAPATVSGASATLPVKGGLAKAKSLDGVLLHRGALKFATSSKSLVLRHITLYKLGKRAHLAAVVGGKVLRLANVVGLTATATGKTATVSGELHLTAAVARLINKLAGKHVVSAGYDFGSFTSTLNIK
jgi:hypothetical protein